MGFVQFPFASAKALGTVAVNPILTAKLSHIVTSDRGRLIMMNTEEFVVRV